MGGRRGSRQAASGDARGEADDDLVEQSARRDALDDAPVGHLPLPLDAVLQEELVLVHAREPRPQAT